MDIDFFLINIVDRVWWSASAAQTVIFRDTAPDFKSSACGDKTETSGIFGAGKLALQVLMNRLENRRIT